MASLLEGIPGDAHQQAVAQDIASLPCEWEGSESDQRRGWHLLRSGPLGLKTAHAGEALQWESLQSWRANRWGVV